MSLLLDRAAAVVGDADRNFLCKLVLDVGYGGFEIIDNICIATDIGQ
ncbi:MAG: hypothetical protein IJ367_03950 [Clostridia bacterium]|nr:hypothetical protein [Clostridia bacterium]